jgi:hypothetical protein
LTAGIDPDAPLRRLERSARELAERRHFLLFSHQARFASPLVPAEREALLSAPAIVEEAVQRVVEEILLPGKAPRCAPGAPPAIFFPAPLARALAAGEALEPALERFHYELVRVDEEQRWTWRGLPVAPRTRQFFLEHTRFEPALRRWVFEYRVNELWWDKSYLEAEVTPFLAISLERAEGAEMAEKPDEPERTEEAADGAAAVALLQDGRRVPLLAVGCRLDRRERLFLRCAGVAEALCSETLRFKLLRSADEALRTIEVLGRRVPLVGDEGADREPLRGG